MSRPRTPRQQVQRAVSSYSRVYKTRRLGDVAKLDGLRERTELLQALILDLADALARHVERPPDLVERARMLPVEPVAQLQHLAFAAGESAEDLAQCLLAHRDLGLFVGQRQVHVGEEVAELRLVLVADRLLQRDRRLRAAEGLPPFVRAQIEVLADLYVGRLAAELGAKLALGADDLVELLHDVDGHPDRARLVRESARNGLEDPPSRVGRELETLAVVELLRGANEANRYLMDQIEDLQ